MAKTAITHKDIITEVGKGIFHPVYLLMGEESYYIDRLTGYIASHAITEEEAAFNLTTIYATNLTTPAEIINASKRYPMMSKYQVVIVKECQNVKKTDDLAFYLEKPLKSTILILSYKNGTMDRRKKVVSLIENSGVVYVSNRVKEYALPQFITDYLKRKHVAIDHQATMMLVENIGSDLNRMAGELDKLCITLPQGTTSITPEHIEKNIGISKNFNQWELKDAIINKDVMKANRIINYFCDNPKANPLFMTVSMLFNFFAALMQIHYAPDRSEQGLMAHLGLKSSYQLKDYRLALPHYSAMKTMRIIGKLRETDAKLKGVEKGGMTTDADVMRELVFFILH